MSIESAKAYMKRLKQDQEFAMKSEQYITEAQMAFANEEGFTFTPEELKQATGEVTVSDDDLDQVAGGSSGGVITAYVCNCCGLAMININGICRNLR
jgi:predicted ribosomally synthesized peptide with nif11-like leader